MGKWNTSIKELLFNYKGALQSLVPWLEKSKIPYKEGEAYDEWDAIALTIYESMVINSIIYSEGLINKNPFAKYDLQYENYNGLNFLLCEDPEGRDEFLVFVSFSAEDYFEMINTCKVKKDSFDVILRSKIKARDVIYYLYQQIPIENITIDI